MKSFSSSLITIEEPHIHGYWNTRTKKINKITLHHCMGTFKGSLNWLTKVARPENPTSAHFMVNEDDVAIMNGPTERMCWSDGNISNQSTISIEMANSTNSAPWPITEKTLRKTAELCAELSRFYGLGRLVLNKNIFLHNHFFNTACPGPTGIARSGDIIRWANEILERGNIVTPANPKPITNTNITYSPGLYEITGTGLRIRSGAGTNHKITGSVKKGEVFTIVEVQGSWGKLKSGAGWISLEYAKTVSGQSSQKIGLYRITGTGLRIRAGAGTHHKIVGSVKKGEVFTIVEVQGVWGKLKSGVGWISLDYAQKV